MRPVRIPPPQHSSVGLAGRETPPDAQSEHRADRAIDLAVFDVNLWHAPEPSPIAAVEAEPPQPPPNLELIAIVAEGSRYLAALYDATSDRLHIAGAGESIGSLQIIGVDAGGVELRGPSRQFRLTIRTLASGPRESIDAMLLARQEQSEP
ncbi:MAG: hypothetical protein IT430_20445 [Phycisphaerales bacterium]|nr:hypothetical protein [Phycisphaerales bacterium]